MIRKPDAHEFRESSTVVAIRDAGTIAVEGARGVRDGTASFLRTGLLALMGLAFLLSLVSHIRPVGFLLVSAGGIALTVRKMKGRARLAARDRAARWSEPAPAVPSTVGAIDPVSMDLSVGAAARSAATIGVPAILFFPTSSIVGYMMPFTLGATIALALAFLILARLAGDRTVLRYDAEALTVRGLLGEATILWIDVGDVVVRTAAWWDVRVWFTSGARRNIVVLGRVNRLGGPDTLYIPVSLLGLDTSALAHLVGRLAALRGGAAAAGDNRQPAGRHGLPLSAAPVAARRHDEPFDPDAIIARYLAAREAEGGVASAGPVAPQRPVFGRKTA